MERAKAQEALAQEMHRKREEMVDSNLEKMHMVGALSTAWAVVPMQLDLVPNADQDLS